MKPEPQFGTDCQAGPESTPQTSYVGIGSNLGDRKENMRKALHRLAASGDVQVRRVSSLYESDPVGYSQQPPFLNAAAMIQTDRDAYGLLKILQAVEIHLGRERRIKWGPRVIDLDLLLSGACVIMDENLTIPHPEMTRRKFVLLPLREIGPEVIHPVIGRTLNRVWDEISADVAAQEVQCMEGPSWYA